VVVNDAWKDPSLKEVVLVIREHSHISSFKMQGQLLANPATNATKAMISEIFPKSYLPGIFKAPGRL
jgi:hypothetical protein